MAQARHAKNAKAQACANLVVGLERGNMNIYSDRIDRLRVELDREGIATYIVFTNDFHNSEYVGEHFKSREYLSGFTGSAGTLVVRQDEALLWTDGRYFIQAEDELCGSGIKLMKMGEKDVPSIYEYLASVSDFDDVIGFDGKCVSVSFVEKLDEELDGLSVTYAYEEDLVNRIWIDRPLVAHNKIWMLGDQYNGEETCKKLERLVCDISDKGADLCMITSLDDIAWLLNLRGSDIDYNPVFMAYMLVSKYTRMLYVSEDAIEGVSRYLSDNNITIRPYDAFYEDIAALGERCVMLDKEQINFCTYMSLDEKTGIIDCQCPVTFYKAIKNTTECDNLKNAHIKDGVAVTRFIYNLKKLVKHDEITEIKAAAMLEEYRKEEKGYLFPSFEPIMAYGEHGAIVHYSAESKTDALLRPEGLLLFDTGGHYYEGTTDITRTISLGAVTDEEKRAYTLVLKGHLNLANARFKKGTTGAMLDILAREPLWRLGLDFNHGTGHGVGYLLCVHEGPNSFQYKREQSAKIVPGMVTSDEPGLYIEGRFGIRHESLILCKENDINKDFYEFEYLTMVPFDKDCIDITLLNSDEITYLNEYHRQVFEKISPYFKDEEYEWLRYVTNPIEI